jgi:hypothetical protein
LFVMSSDGFARQMKLEWIDNSNCDYRACSIDGQRFGREWLNFSSACITNRFRGRDARRQSTLDLEGSFMRFSSVEESK